MTHLVEFGCQKVRSKLVQGQVIKHLRFTVDLRSLILFVSQVTDGVWTGAKGNAAQADRTRVDTVALPGTWQIASPFLWQVRIRVACFGLVLLARGLMRCLGV